MSEKNGNATNKVMVCLRIQPDVYWKIFRKVNAAKEKNRSYSMNQYITDLIEKDLAKSDK